MSSTLRSAAEANAPRVTEIGQCAQASTDYWWRAWEELAGEPGPQALDVNYLISLTFHCYKRLKSGTTWDTQMGRGSAKPQANGAVAASVALMSRSVGSSSRDDFFVLEVWP